MVKKKSGLAALLLCLLLLFGLGMGMGTAWADNAVDDAVTELSGIYDKLDDTDKAALASAKGNVGGSVDWNGVLDPIVTTGVKDALGGHEQAKEDLKKLITDFAAIQYSSSETELTNAIQSFKDKNQDTVAKLLPGITADNLVGYYSDCKAKVPSVVTKDATLQDLINIASGNYSSIVDSLNGWMKTAAADILDKDEWDNLEQAYIKLGWTADTLIEAKERLAKDVDSNNEAQIALAKGYVRSETELTSGDTSLRVDETTTYGLSILGVAIAGDVVSWTTRDSTIATMDGKTLTAVKAGTTEVIAFRPGGNVNTEWVYKFDVTVTSRTTGGGGGGGGGGPGTPPGTGDPEEDTEQAEETLNDPDAGDDQVADSVNSAADSLEESSAAIENAEQAEQVAAVAAKLAGVLDAAAARVQDPTAAGELGDAANKVIDALANAVTKVDTAESKEQISQNAVKTMNAVMVALTRMDAAKATRVTTEMAKNAGTLVKALQGRDAANVAEKVVLAAQKAVERAGTQQVDAGAVTVDNGKAGVTVSLDGLTAKAQQAAQAAGKLSASMKENGIPINKKVETKITVQVPTTGAQQVETRLPAGALDGLAASGVGIVQVKTEVAFFSVDADTFGQDVRGKEVALAAAKVARESLPAAARNQVPSGSVVVDLDASLGGEKVGTFDKPVEVAIPYTPAAGENTDAITVFLLKDDGTLQPMGGKYDSVTGTVKFKAPHFSKYFAKITQKTFGDLGNHAWAKDSIEILAGKGVIAGKSANAFDPGAAVTRAEFSALAVRMLGLAVGEADTPFKDVPTDAWYSRQVATAYANGIVGGKSADQFDPGGKITMQEMAVIISRIMVAEGFARGDGKDLGMIVHQDKVADWARTGTALVAREGIIDGMGDGGFAPGEEATRAQTAVMLYRLYEKLF
ncbi:MAG: S-layer homology domain-containing protein [Firmicutes bacterium]|nr:S-layer homology domain-containing protein [Bacillota bacterium]